MSLLDDARQLDCMCNADEGNHVDTCVLAVKPRLVAALEAADLVLWGVDRDSATMHIALADLRKAMQGEGSE